MGIQNPSFGLLKIIVCDRNSWYCAIMTLRHCLMLFAAPAIFVCLSSSLAGAQEDNAQTVNIPLSFQAGAVADISYSQEYYNNQTPTKQVKKYSSVKATASMEVMDTDQNNPLMSWTLKSYRVEEAASDKNEPIIENLFLDVPTKYHADEKGAPLNLQDIETLTAALSETASLPGFENPKYKDFVDIIDGTSKLVGGPFLAAFFLEIPELISICHGTNLVMGQVKTYQDDRPIFGASGPKVNVSYHLTSIDDVSKVAEINFMSKVDIDSQKERMMEKRQKLSLPPLSDKDMEAALLHSTERAACLVDLDTGWVQEITYQIQYFHTPKFEAKNYKVELDWR